MSDIEIDPEELVGGDGARMKTKLPGIEVTTRLDDADPEEPEHAEDAKEASRM